MSNNPSLKTCPEGVYHEKQSRELCALHALNNLFQGPKSFTKQELDDICNTMSPDSIWFNPHRSIMGLGNYDVNVVMSALQTRGYDVLWFDKRKNVDELNLANIMGFILNIPTDFTIGILHIPIARKHWIAVRQVDAVYYNFDSKLKAPAKIGVELDLKTYLKEKISSKENELLVVFDSKMERDALWTTPKTMDENLSDAQETDTSKTMNENLSDAQETDTSKTMDENLSDAQETDTSKTMATTSTKD